jgi:hypothetical protein
MEINKIKQEIRNCESKMDRLPHDSLELFYIKDKYYALKEQLVILQAAVKTN